MESQGEGYYVSEIQTGGIARSVYPWLVLCSYKKMTDAGLFKFVKNVYDKEKPFFILLTMTTLMMSASIFVILPRSLLLWLSLALQSLLILFIPMMMFFGIYLWAGLILKHQNMFFSMKACLLSCVVLELFTELASKLFRLDIQAESPFSLVILTVLFGVSLTATGTLFENMNHVGTLALVNSFIVVRIFVLPLTTILDGWFSGLKILLVYSYILLGLAFSTWPSLKIFNSNVVAPTPQNTSTNASTIPVINALDEMNNIIPVIRQRRASNIDMQSITQNGLLQNQNKTRRKSLPALGAPSARKISMSSMDLTILGEAHGMITDLLADTTLPLNVTGTLRIVADMISPLLQHSLHHRQNGPLLTVMEKSKTNQDQEKVMNQPDLKDDTPLSLKQRLQRNLGVSNRRMSSSYTTTTSATGMPSIGMEYHTKKSNSNNNNSNSKSSANSSPVAIKKTSSRSKSYAGVLTPAERSTLLKSHSRSFSQSSPTTPHNNSPTTNGLFPIRKDLATSDETIFKVEIERGKPVFFEGMDASESENENNESTDEDSSIVKDIVTICNNNNNNGRTNKFVLDERLADVKETPEKEVLLSRPTNSVDVNCDISTPNDLNSVAPNKDMNLATNETEITDNNINILKRDSSIVDNDNVIEPPSTDDIVKETPKKMPLEENKDSLVNKEHTSSTALTTPPRRSLRKVSDTSRTLRRASSSEVEGTYTTVKSSDSGDNLGVPAPSGQLRRKSSRELHMEYEIAISRDIDEMLGKVEEWDFPIFELSEKCNVLTQLAFRIFQLCDFFKTFKIPEVTFLKFFRALESGYHNIPYHNRIHAADVLHGVYYLTQHRIPGFTGNPPSRRVSTNEKAAICPPAQDGDVTIDDDNDCDEENDEVALRLKSLTRDPYAHERISDSVPDLELMALYVAAAMHDFDHPGRTNAFLVATLNSKALLYNDRSVLESHHAAASWSLLVSNPGLNFLSTLDAADFKRFRFIVIEEILSTDLKKHFDFLTEWNAKISDQGGGLNFTSEADRLLLGQMAIKIADISGPSKEWDLHYRWTERIIEEFYQQGEDERNLGMPPSAYMDRESPQVPSLQASFIKHLVQPLYIAYEKAGILPGEWVEDDEDDEENENEDRMKESNSDSENKDSSEINGVVVVTPPRNDNLEDAFTTISEDTASNISEDTATDEGCDDDESSGPKKVAFCIMSENIKRNYEKWLRIIEEEKDENSTRQDDDANDGDVDDDNTSDET